MGGTISLRDIGVHPIDSYSAANTTTSLFGILTYCPICGNSVYGLLKDANGNMMCKQCYKEIYGCKQ